jgi:hypothetical protein
MTVAVYRSDQPSTGTLKRRRHMDRPRVREPTREGL